MGLRKENDRTMHSELMLTDALTLSLCFVSRRVISEREIESILLGGAAD